MQLAKKPMRVFSVMGLGPTGADGQVLNSDGICSAGSNDQCSATTSMTTATSDHDSLLYIFMFLLLFPWLVFGGVTMWFFRKWKREMGVATSDHCSLAHRYMQLVSQRSIGFHRHADSTDAAGSATAADNDGDGGEEGAASEAAENDVEVPVNPPSKSHIVGSLRTLLNECLAREEFSDSSAVVLGSPRPRAGNYGVSQHGSEPDHRPRCTI